MEDVFENMTEEEAIKNSKIEDVVQNYRRKVIFNTLKNVAIGVGTGLVIGAVVVVAFASGRDKEETETEETVLVESYE